MDVPARVVHPLLVLAVVIAGVLGYLAGSHHSASSTRRVDLGGRARLASSSGLLLEYPLGWERVSSPPSIPDLPLSSPVALEPRGGASTGLLSGQLPAGEAAPLPSSFVARLSATPKAEIVDLVSTQAYRYSHLQLPGYDAGFDLYVIPNGSGAPRALACFSSAALSVAQQQCERIVASVSLSGVSAPVLAPEPAYASKLAAVLSGLEAARVSARTQMSGSASAAEVAPPASSLAGRFAAAANAVDAIEAPAPAAVAQTALAAALRRAGTAYTSLAEAARTESVGEYDSARGQVASAESGVDSALESFTLLGYGSAQA